MSLANNLFFSYWRIKLMISEIRFYVLYILVRISLFCVYRILSTDKHIISNLDDRRSHICIKTADKKL